MSPSQPTPTERHEPSPITSRERKVIELVSASMPNRFKLRRRSTVHPCHGLLGAKATNGHSRAYFAGGAAELRFRKRTLEGRMPSPQPMQGKIRHRQAPKRSPRFSDGRCFRGGLLVHVRRNPVQLRRGLSNFLFLCVSLGLFNLPVSFLVLPISGRPNP